MIGVGVAIGLVGSLIVGCTEPPAPTIDILDLLPLARVHHEIARIDVGEASDQSWLREGWSIAGTREDGSSYRWISADEATLEVWLGQPADREMVWRGWPLSFPNAPVQTLRVEANGETLGELALRAGWAANDYRVAWPASAQRAGTNTIRLIPSARHIPAEVVPGSDDPRGLATAWAELRLEGGRAASEPRRRERATQPTLVMPTGSRVELFLGPGAASRLLIDRLSVAGADASSAPWLRVSTLVDLGDEVHHTFREEDGEGLSLDLPVVDRPMRLALQAIADGGRDGVVQLIAPRLEIDEEAFAADSATPADATAESSTEGLVTTAGSSWNVLVYLVDSLRADHLSTYGYERPTSPELDRFAAEAVRFDHVVAQASWTRAAVASLLTGLYPHAHGAVGREDRVADETPYLAEILSAQGYATAGFVTNGNVSAPFGFERGYDEYRHLTERDTVDHHTLSDELNEVAFDWLARRDASRPFFLYVHSSDPHYPYRPRSPFLETFAGDVVDPSVGDLEPVIRLIRGTASVDARGRQDLIDLYDGEIAFNDHHFGRLLDHLETAGLADRTIVVFVGDHGEEFLDHDGWGHGATLYEEQLRVPLVIRLPDARAAGRVVREPVRQIDVLPTLLEALGAPVPPDVQGQSRLAAMLGADDMPSTSRPSFAELHLDGEDADAIVDGGFKLIVDGSGDHIELFDLTTDVAEQHDLSTERPALAGYLRAQLLARRTATAARAANREAADIDPELRSRLEALGYLN